MAKKFEPRYLGCHLFLTGCQPTFSSSLLFSVEQESREAGTQKLRKNEFPAVCGGGAEIIVDSFLKTDLHFFPGTTQLYHFVAPNPWVIIGVFHPPDQTQRSLL